MITQCYAVFVCYAVLRTGQLADEAAIDGATPLAVIAMQQTTNNTDSERRVPLAMNAHKLVNKIVYSAA